MAADDRHSPAELARLFDLSEQTVRRRLGGVPYVVRGRSRTYLISEAAPALLQVGERFLPEQEIGRLNALRADAQELRNAELRRELLPAELVVETLARVSSEIVAILDTIPAELRRGNPSLTARDLERVKFTIARARNAAASIQIEPSALHA